MPDRYKPDFQPPQHPPYCTCARCNDPEGRVVAEIDEQQAQAHAAYLWRLQRVASHEAAKYRWNLPQARTPSPPTGSSIGGTDARRPGVPPSPLSSPLPAASRFGGDASVPAPQDQHAGAGAFLALLAGGVIALGIVAVTTFGIPDLFRHTLDVGCTGSMEPTLSCGDKIVVSLVGTTSPALELGDAIVFPQCPEDWLRYTRWRGPGSNAHAEVMVVHRIIEVGTDRNGDLAYRTRGDANTRAEPCWTKHRNVRFVVDEIVNGE